MKLRLSISARVLSLLAANILLLLLLMLGSAGWGSLLSDSAKARLASIGSQITSELSQLPQAQWPALLDRYSERYGVDFSASRLKFPHDGPGPGGPPPPRGEPPPDSGFVPPPRDAAEPRRAAPPPHLGGPDGRIEMRPASWLGPYRMVVPGAVSTIKGTRPFDLIIGTDSFFALIRFLGVGEWLGLALLAVLLSALLWAPFIIGMLRAIVKMQAATQRMAEGAFDVRLSAGRSDELGELASSINEMAARLQRYLQGQKQFLADVAHETISPLARIQLGLGLLESRLDAAAQQQLQDVQEDARQMAELLNELLLFSRAGMNAERATPQLLGLRALVLVAAEREDASALDLDVEPGLQVLAHEALLLRALANLIRNARRYAGDARIEVQARPTSESVILSIRDHGPGVSDAALTRLGEPFFRAEAARDRDSGGYGLGLAIVRRCVEACGGSVHFRNHPAGGFEAELRLLVA